MARAVNKGLGTIKRLIKHYPDQLAEAFLIAAEHTRCKSTSWRLDSNLDLYVAEGPSQTPGTAGYWSMVKVFTPTLHGIRVGGIWGKPVRDRMRDVVSVEHEVLYKFLEERGWRFICIDETGGRVYGKPELNKQGLSAVEFLENCFQLPSVSHPIDPE